MQEDMFNPRSQEPPPSVADLTLLEHPSTNYAPRTGENAHKADATVAFAIDFHTAGEKLTARIARNKYIGILLMSDVGDAAQALLKHLRRTNARSLNVAGNGIYTLARNQVTQAHCNQWVYDVLKQVHDQHPLSHIRSGGQTGVDTAGLVAALALEVPATGLYPHGFKRRNQAQIDFNSTSKSLEKELRDQAHCLQR